MASEPSDMKHYGQWAFRHSAHRQGSALARSVREHQPFCSTLKTHFLHCSWEFSFTIVFALFSTLCVSVSVHVWVSVFACVYGLTPALWAFVTKYRDVWDELMLFFRAPVEEILMIPMVTKFDVCLVMAPPIAYTGVDKDQVIRCLVMVPQLLTQEWTKTR